MKRIAALLIGINDYAWDPLHTPVRDVGLVQEALQRIDPHAEIDTLIDSAATVPMINQHLRVLRETAAPLSIFYFAGHGCKTDIDSYLCTFEGEPGNEGIPLTMLLRQMPRRSDGSSWLAILDCCHSAPTTMREIGISRTDIEAALSGFGASRAVVAACGPDDEAVEIGQSQSPFTNAVVAALDGAAANFRGEVTLGALYDFSCVDLGRQHLPIPVLIGDLSSSFIIADGLPPRGTEPLAGQSKERVLLDAERFAASVRPYMAVPEDVWARQGWIEACNALRPIIRWFSRTRDEHKELTRDERFVRSSTVIERHLSYLASIGAEIHTEFGQVQRRLGQGGFGTVWAIGDDASATPRYAYKVFHPEELHNTEKQSRFERGYRAMEQLNHTQIVHVIKYSDTPPGIVMDYINGLDLRALGSIGETEEQLGILHSIAKTLQYAHSKQVIHRDIKPENVILRWEDGKWIPVITDFDLAWFPTATQITQAAMGHAFYAAPEQIQQPRSGRSRRVVVDVFSFGQLMYFLMTGRDPKPLESTENANALELILRREKGLSNRTISALLNVYSACTSLDPKARFSKMNDVAAALKEVRVQETDRTEAVELSFRGFCNSLVSRFGGRIVATPQNWKVTAESRSGRSSLELILDPTELEWNRKVVQVRIKTYDSHKVEGTDARRGAKNRNSARVDAIVAKDRAFTGRMLNDGFRIAELRIHLPILGLKEAVELGQRLRKAISAAERIDVKFKQAGGG
jgi:eukaryotic-like serine/threonine-protein kinase